MNNKPKPTTSARMSALIKFFNEYGEFTLNELVAEFVLDKHSLNHVLGEMEKHGWTTVRYQKQERGSGSPTRYFTSSKLAAEFPHDSVDAALIPARSNNQVTVRRAPAKQLGVKRDEMIAWFFGPAGTTA